MARGHVLGVCCQLQKTCQFVEKPKEDHELKIEALQREIEFLKSRLQPTQEPMMECSPATYSAEDQSSFITASRTEIAAHGVYTPAQAQVPPQPVTSTSTSSPDTATFLIRSQGRSRSAFETDAIAPTIAELGIEMKDDEGRLYFNAFFSGCDRYVPVFDQRFDTIEAIRSQSPLLFITICSVGCRVLNGTSSRWRALALQTQRMLNAAIVNPLMGSLETVQAILVQACYARERALLIAIATRMALDLGFPEAYDTLIAEAVLGEMQMDNSDQAIYNHNIMRMRKTRVWLHLLVMSYILHVDAGGMPTFKFRGASRRCRVLLQSPLATGMDHYLFAQVELNVLRAKIYASLPQGANLSDEEILDLVKDAKLDIDVWFQDWIRISLPHHDSMPWFVPNLSVQRCWADNMALCRAVRAAGVENVNVMSPIQKNILSMTKASLQQHLDIIIQEPRIYLKSIRYAMDFVWAKNTFCCLLLLKLSALLPDTDKLQTQGRSDELVIKASILLQELEVVAAAGHKDDTRSNTSLLYLQLLKTSIQKYKCWLAQDEGGPRGGQSTFPLTQERNCDNELESFVPDQFVFEWDFPGLTLFSSPINETGWINELLAGAQEFGENGSSINWALIDFSM
ncbi:hypothetical protein FVEG_17485 [Fusarium verticillioides 7600]|uniref:Transcription factor domain-containing protein n=1 Tax=Gibberella moniliformis (strain M3125 / FGSC 7600) TaxID=334819 RepID=W7MUR1_GIBM7|nr:hypothetical protein FVEG_17485 [Fusarium verticillioides 7600]EWG55268.1 hypothetical protein FVEG_17485 [Fusarium verticillioides 7600]